MAEFRRLISYLYEYEGKVKGKNVGFVKLETRNGLCKLNVSVKKLYMGSGNLGVYLLSARQEIFLGNLFLRNGSGEFRTVVQSSDIEQSGESMNDCYGLSIHEKNDTWKVYTTIWEDTVAQAAQLALESAAAENPSSVLAVLENPEEKTNEPKQEQAQEQTQEEYPELPESFSNHQPEERAEQEHQIKENEAGNNYQQKSNTQEARIRKTEEDSSEILKKQKEAEKQEETEKQKEIEEPLKREILSNVETSMSQPANEMPRNRMFGAPPRRMQNQRQPAQQASAVRPAMPQPQPRPRSLNRPVQPQTNYLPQSLPVIPQMEEALIVGDPEALAKLEKEENTTQVPIWDFLEKTYPKIQAFDSQYGCQVLVIKPQDIGLLPREIWIYGNNSFLLHGYYNYRYLILARLENPNGSPRYLLGVPGHYYNNEKYMASMFGFPNFVLSKKQQAQDGRFGYWYTDIRLNDGNVPSAVLHHSPFSSGRV